MSTPQTNGSGGRIGIDFVDVLFAIVMGISATEVLDEPWFKHGPSLTWQSTSLFEISVLLLGYVTLIASWVGYHKSVGTNPQDIDTVPEWITFIIDIVLLGCYLLILVKFDNFLFVLSMLVIVFILYVVWDFFQQQQRTFDNKEAPQGMGISRFWAICFALLLTVYLLLDFYDLALVIADRVPELGSDAILMAWNWVFLALAFTSVLLYRRHKNTLCFKPLLKMLGHWP